MAKKKGPPYTDDPGCKYIVIDDPWPGNKRGKARDQVYYNHLCTWVYFMLGKSVKVDALYTMNTRDEIIVQLPQSVDLSPILGAHPWRRFLSRGDQRDKDRVSYVFEYNYRSRGEPGNHNWLEGFPTVSGDPPPHLGFPVIFPYPHVSWATPKGKNCGDIALPLPPTRQPTPIADTSLFAPYQHPSQLTTGTVDSANVASTVESVRQERNSSGKLGKMDPYDEDANALRSLSVMPRDEKPTVKQEAVSFHIKQDPGGPGSAVKREAEPHGPSKAFRRAVERLQQGRGDEEDTGSAPPGGEKVTKVEEDSPSGPSARFVEAFNRYRRSDPEPVEDPRIKQDITDDPQPAPSEAFKAAFSRLRGIQSAQASSVPVQVKPEPVVASPLGTTGRNDRRVKSEPMESVTRARPASGATRDPRLGKLFPSFCRGMSHEPYYSHQVQSE
ncbi:hypothetical protein C8Q78DRAFT_961717 [Trametes maxima]|nr:hypothetical protein C8Q78DRAFT_961717 [Trametes maxima]